MLSRLSHLILGADVSTPALAVLVLALAAAGAFLIAQAIGRR